MKMLTVKVCVSFNQSLAIQSLAKKNDPYHTFFVNSYRHKKDSLTSLFMENFLPSCKVYSPSIKSNHFETKTSEPNRIGLQGTLY